MANQSKKVVIATGTFLPEVSGQASFVFNLIQHLPAEIKTQVISYGSKAQIKDNVIFIKRNAWRFLNYYCQLKQQAKSAEIIYVHDLISSGLPAALAKGKNKLIIRLGGDFLWEKMVNLGYCQVPLSQYYNQPKSFREKIYLSIYRFVLNKCDKIIFNTQFQAELYQKVFKVPEDKIKVIPNPVETKAQVQSSVGNQIIYAGRLIPLKNLTRLIQAFKNIQTDQELVLIGHGPQKKELKKLSADNKRIKILDSLVQKELWQKISQSYLFILPSLSELNPNSALEALSLGKPVILTKENGLPRELKNKFELINPLSVESIQQALEYFLDENNYNNYLKQLDFDFAKYTWQNVTQQHLELFYEHN